ncbi:RHS repeat-associated core domain-containing protein [Roseimaritima sediminicola]|uniref:RHS repeat-associated core domain-containing protein n=1 Tax=Roseimaritima sediminicola TaxID=2662066 RepID=UPI00129857A6|nr:RHS repeat-associated core domain-containing protein [Roseimaritima sediminicola]
MTDPSGIETVAQQDALGRMRTIIGDVPTQNTRYWADGTVRSATDQLGNVARFDYDRRGRLTTAHQPRPEATVASPEVGYQYTVDGLLTAVTDPLGRVTSYNYDDGGRLPRVTQPDPDGAGSLAAAYTDYVYDSLGNTVSTSDALGQTNTVERDAWYRVIASTNPSSATTSTRYDVFGNIVNITDPLGNETDYTYNRLNQLVTEGKVYGSGTQNRSYAYDGAGNLRSLVDRNDRRTEWAYDNRYRVSSETWKTGASVDRTLTYAYDTSDRTTSIDDSDPLATDFQFAYNDRSQLLAERQLTGLIGTSAALNRAFDGNGDRITLGANFGGTLSGTSIVGGIDDFARQFTYDGLGRVTSVNSDAVSGGHAVAPQLATFEYNAASQRTDLRRYSATTASVSDLQIHSRRGYDHAGRLTSITHGTAEIAAGETWDGTSTLPASLGAADMLAGYVFGYDQDNRLVEFAFYRDGTETSYAYDSRDQLTSATTAAIAGLSQPFGLASSESYDFDAGGNRKSSGGQSQSAADSHNQLQTDGTYNYTYDDEGNTLSKTSIATGEVTEYDWDHRNRLVLVTERASAGGAITQQVQFIYDAFDQRVGKRVDSDSDGTWDRDEAFVWADGQTVLRFVDSDGEAVSESFRVANRYLYGDVVDEVLADEQYAAGSGPAVNSGTASTTASETLWTIADHLGSVRDLVDNNGVVRQHVVYDSFGNRLIEQDYDASGTAIASSHASAVDTLFGYTGRDWDADVELQNNRARWYDPITGRWLSQDPIGFNAGDANLYRYVGNGPTEATDPSGLDERENAPADDPWAPWMTTIEGYGGKHYEIRNNLFAQAVGYTFAYTVWPLTGSGPRTNAPAPPSSFAGSQTRQQTHYNNVLEGNNFEARNCPSQPVPPAEQAAIWVLAEGNYEFYAMAAGMAGGSVTVSSVGDDVVRHTVGSVNSIPADEFGDVAFGLWRHQETRAGGLLDRFAEHVGARTYGQIYDPRIFPTEEMLENMMRGASRLHVNLDGMCKSIDELPSIVQRGSRGMDYVPPGGGGNITNWEIWRIHQGPEMLSRTIFYIDGKPVKP